jgi:hypothetical protein
MAWIPVFQSLPSHPKTLLGSQLSRMDNHKFVGHLIEFWLWALDVSGEDGLLPGLPFDMLGQRAGLPHRQSENFITALIECGFLNSVEGRLVLHNWSEYGGKLQSRREKERNRQREKRGSVAPTLLDVAPTLHKRTQADQIRQEQIRSDKRTM